MGIIRLNPADAAKYGAPPEGVPFDLTAVGVRQRSALVRETRKPWGWFIDQLGGVPELDEHQNPIPVPVIDPDTGEQKVENGEPVFTPKLVQDGDAIAMLVWLALWGAGIKVPWDNFDILATDLEIDLTGEDDEPGKAEAPETDSASTTNDQN